MDIEILIAFIAIGINFILASFLPQLIEGKQNDMLQDAKRYYLLNRETILTSSIIIGLTVYAALKLTPKIEGSVTEFTGIEYVNGMCPEPQLNMRNLAKLFDGRLDN